MQNLNEDQNYAAMSSLKRLHIVAGPGTGKTSTLVARICNLLDSGLDPAKVVVMTFTNNAAKELKYRVSQALLGNDSIPVNRLVVGTFHAVAVRFLKTQGQKIQIANNSDIKIVFDELNTKRPLQETLGLLSSMKCGKHKGDVEEQMLLDKYNAVLRRFGLVDFDDLLIQFSDLLDQRPSISEGVDAVLIDEFQDTSELQLNIALKLSKHSERLTVVGDPDQSIYSFRNARPQNFDSLRLHGSQPAQLRINYRSTQGIIDTALSVLQSAGRDKDSLTSLKALQSHNCKPQQLCFRSYEDESKAVVEAIGRVHKSGVKLKDIAIISRISRYSRALQIGLKARGLPFRVLGGKMFGDQAAFTQLVDLLRVLLRDDDVLALKRSIAGLCLAIGSLTLQKMFAKKQDFQAAVNYCLGAEATTKQKRSLAVFVKWVRENRELLNDAPLTVVRNAVKFLRKSRPEPKTELQIEGNKADDETFDLMVAQLEAQQNESDGFDLGEMIAQWTCGLDCSSKVDDCLTVSTAHSSKGLEWPVVFVIGCCETEFASKSSAENGYPEMSAEERRLLYVALTRAKSCLFMTSASLKKSNLFTKSSFTGPFSAIRFDQTCLKGVIPEIQTHFKSAFSQMTFASTGLRKPKTTNSFSETIMETENPHSTPQFSSALSMSSQPLRTETFRTQVAKRPTPRSKIEGILSQPFKVPRLKK